ncbi:MAG: hypothetical protein A3J81_08680 [Nitrospirae bacterium RIFOXYB2_FULL_43_5]|nr:MAG: hypothetical protein A2X54_00965 [Nitrospirae bacterium GWF2_44_13]OGW33071.1 MAG: hypothetical protein A2088_07570 [Nitrospirae bacterium GWD2_44_7]OGW66439.1 MAG: hypothetical protein A2222_08780 [Nitrospirae bacterium RIFOXYA2_FULL_44_9]OGW73825.1 MAG: hypothetical protein A2484_08375 [Nitrospirae bacterium RIFOXYC2_FULL_44_7]OGW74045.1 MAG: hypothetical protein A3J81_08680 [Nitrospirae bacterium RIFOXYB2_FULL_43_5]
MECSPETSTLLTAAYDVSADTTEGWSRNGVKIKIRDNKKIVFIILLRLSGNHKHFILDSALFI